MDLYKNAMNSLIQGQGLDKLSSKSSNQGDGELQQNSVGVVGDGRKWMVSVQITSSQCVTQSQESGFEKYIPIKSYREEILLVGNQNEGIKGVYSSNVLFSVNRNHSSVELLNAFQDSKLIEGIRIIQTVDDGKARRVNDNLFFSQCKIVKVESNQGGLVFYFRYGKRSETFGIQEKTSVPPKVKGPKIDPSLPKVLPSLVTLQVALGALSATWAIILAFPQPITLAIYPALPTFMALKAVFKSLESLMQELVKEKYLQAVTVIPLVKTNELLLDKVIAKINSVFAMVNNIAQEGAGAVHAAQDGNVDGVVDGAKDVGSGTEDFVTH